MLYINGDSWSQETEWARPNNIWPGLFSQQIHVPYINESAGCGSNSRMLHCLENFYITSNRADTVILALSGHTRWHLPNNNFGVWHVGTDSVINEHNGQHDYNIGKWLVANSYNEVDSVYRYYKTIWNLVELCKKFNSNYLFFNAWDTDIVKLGLMSDSANIKKFVNQYHKAGDVFAEKYIKGLEFFRSQRPTWNYIDTPLSTLLDQEDYDPTNHPLPSGHRKMANFIYQNY